MSIINIIDCAIVSKVCRRLNCGTVIPWEQPGNEASYYMHLILVYSNV